MFWSVRFLFENFALYIETEIFNSRAAEQGSLNKQEENKNGQREQYPIF